MSIDNRGGTLIYISTRYTVSTIHRVQCLEGSHWPPCDEGTQQGQVAVADPIGQYLLCVVFTCAAHKEQRGDQQVRGLA